MKSFRDSLKRKKFENTSIVLCPPIIHLESFLKGIKNKNVSFGAQNAHWDTTGAYTGEFSSAMVSGAGA